MKILNRFTGKSVFEIETLRGADLSGADLSGADLSGADLSGADLSGADLSGAVLRGAIGIALAGPLGSRGDFLYGVSGHHDTPDGLMWKAGCRWCDTPALLAAIAETHDDGQYAREYLAAMAFIAARLGVGERAPALAAEAGKAKTP
jgi:uncharacterized protein YjbI with pentapeptide repeats